MNDIVIRGVDLPKDGKISISITSDGNAYLGIEPAYSQKKFETVVLPSHGRLGDLDKFKEEVKDGTLQKPLKNGAIHIIEIGKMFAEMIDDVPTVLEASE